MPDKVTKADVEALLVWANKAGMSDVWADWSYGRVTFLSAVAMGHTIELSRELSKREAEEWLHAFAAGADHVRRAMGNNEEWWGEEVTNG